MTKYAKTLGILVTVIILSTLMVTMPMALAQSERYITLSPTKGKIGETINIVGEGFNKSTSSDKFAAIFFSSQKAGTDDDIGDEVEAYKLVREGVWLDENGAFETTFTVPNELDDGDVEEEVIAGNYYVYVCHYGGNIVSPRIRAVTEFIVTFGEVTINPDSGPVATSVGITGTDFNGNESITIEYDGSEVDIESGDGETDSEGEFISYIHIPESTAGPHTITVGVPGNEVKVEFNIEPEAIFSITSGEANTTVIVDGTGFSRRKDIIIYFNNVGLATVTTDVRGSFSTTFSVPELKAGIYKVQTEDDDENLDTAKFTIVISKPVPTPALVPIPVPAPSPGPLPASAGISSAIGSIGKEIFISGTGFEAGGKARVKYDGVEVATVATDINGAFIATFKVPISKHGKHTVIVSDGTNTEEFIFTVESEAPSAPARLLPVIGAEVQSPIYLDWKDVDDESIPVTYTLQIAISQNFSDTSIVLGKEGLTKSQYTINEKEAIELTRHGESYYWKVRAIDSASNEGEWMSTGEFKIAPSFDRSNWAIYTVIGLGGVLLCSVIYWRYTKYKKSKTNM
ncbi:MAG: hypothetical protein V3V23_05280 [Dehalococcoidales bacterium]